MKVIHLSRRRGEFFSIEQLFAAVRRFLPPEFEVEAVETPRPGAKLAALVANCRFASRLQADLIHVTGDIHYVVPAITKVPVILTIHDLRLIDETRGLRRFLLKLAWVRWPVRDARRITVISEATKEALFRLMPSARDKTVVIPDPVSPAFRPSTKPMGTRPVLLHVGTTTNKNLDRVVAAMQGLDATLWILGLLHPSQHELLERSGCDWKSFAGLPEEDVVKLYESCDAVIFPSLYEGFGLPIVEAQAVGRAVLTSDRSPMRDVAGEGALLVDPESVSSIRSGIERLLGDTGLRETLIEAGFENVKRFSAESIAAQYAELYREVLSR